MPLLHSPWDQKPYFPHKGHICKPIYSSLPVSPLFYIQGEEVCLSFCVAPDLFLSKQPLLIIKQKKQNRTIAISEAGFYLCQCKAGK